MKEVVVIKSLRRNKVQSSLFFDNYDKALDFALSQCWKGYWCIVLRKVDNRWYKGTLYPPDNL